MANETYAQLEDAALDALAALDHTQPGGYLRTRKSYQGELDVESADQLHLQYPALLLFIDAVGWTPSSTTGLDYVERPELVVFVGDQNWRGEKEARRGGIGGSEVGSYKMLRDVVAKLAGKTFGLAIGPLIPQRARAAFQSLHPPVSIYEVRFTFNDVSFIATGDA